MTEAEHARRTPSPQRGEGWGEGAPAVGDGAPVRHDWTRAEVRALFDLPFPELMFRAQSVHRANFEPGEVQISTLLSIKTGGCPEDCAYCPQSASYDTGVRAAKLMASTRCCRGRAQGRRRQPLLHGRGVARTEGPRPRSVCEMVGASRRSGWRPAPRSACSPTPGPAAQGGGPRCYNHNLDTSPEFYANIITTRTYRGPPGDARPRARRRHQRLLRRHRRHGRDAARIASA